MNYHLLGNTGLRLQTNELKSPLPPSGDLHAFSVAEPGHGEQAPSLLTAFSGVPSHQRRLSNNVTLDRGIENLAL